MSNANLPSLISASGLKHIKACTLETSGKLRAALDSLENIAPIPSEYADRGSYRAARAAHRDQVERLEALCDEITKTDRALRTMTLNPLFTDA